MADPAPVPVHAFDDRPLEFTGEDWPVEAPPFEAPEFRSPWHAVQYGAMRAAQRFGLVLPRPLREALVRGVAGVARRVDRRHTEAARDFLRTALPELDEDARERLVVEAWRHLQRVAIVAEGLPARLRGARFGDLYDLYAPPDVLAHLEAGAGTLCVTGHMGFWEAAAPAIVAVGLRPAYAIGKAPRNDYVARHVRRSREAQGMRVLPRNGAMQAVPAVVRAGGTVGLLLDHRPRQRPVFAPFFGRPAACDRSAGVLLRRVGAPLLFYGCYGTDDPWRFELRFTKLVPPEGLDGLSPEAICARVNRELEGLVLHRPDQYFWIHDRFKGLADPSDETSGGPVEPAAQG